MGNSSNRHIRPLALVVDDDALIRLDIIDMLEDLGFEVAEADSVSTAITVLQQRGDSVSFLLTDVQMPGSRNGVTLANHVSYIWPHIRILVTSGVMHPVVGELPIEAQFMAKPLSALALNAYVATLSTDAAPQQLS